MNLAVAAAAPCPTLAQTLSPTLGDRAASLRLIAAPHLTNGRYDAGIEITMQPGSHTYWKQPGEAGVPPVFAFNGSENVAAAEVVFPAPKRISEEGLEAFGYIDAVTFPVLVTPKDKGKPAVLKLDMTYAVCHKLCIPAHGSASLTLAPDGAGIDGDKVAAALASVPLPVTDAERADLRLARQPGGDKPSWLVTWAGKPPVNDVFPDAPEGFYFATKKLGADRFLLTADQMVGSADLTKVPVTLTLTRAGGGLVARESLDLTTPSR